MSSFRESIEAAFFGVEHPGDDNLTIYRAEGREFDETFQLLQDTDWTELSVSEFLLGDSPFPDLAPRAFHYFMPAFLLASLDESLEVDVSDSLVFHLSPERSKHKDADISYDNTDEYNKRIALFDTAQRRVIVEVLNEFVRRKWYEMEEIAIIIDRLERRA